MKFTFLSAVAVLAVASVSVGAAAQQAGAETQIVVTAEHQRDWDRGSRLEAEGLKDLGEAEQNLVQRSADVVNLENSRASAASQAENAKRAFETLRAQAEIIDPDQARTWAGQITDAAKDWEDYDDRIQASDSNMQRANRRLADAQEDVAKAQEKVDRGRVMMAAAERLSSPVGSRTAD